VENLAKSIESFVRGRHRNRRVVATSSH
jgi:hypothetical protein